MPIIEGSVGRIQTFAGVPGAGTDAIQTLTIGGTPTGGTFRLKFEAEVTGAITWTATDATLVANIDAALEALTNIGTAGVTAAAGTVSSGIGTVTLTFIGNQAKSVITLITVYSNDLTGTSPTLAVATTTAGVAAAFRGAGKGQLVSDVTNGKLYINSGTALSPTWTVVGSQS